jgi:manganese-dependent inorganic pyrophosphatase
MAGRFYRTAQGPADLLQSNIIGIIDHHRLGGLVTQLPPEVWIKPAGSSATVLWLLMDAEMRRTMPPTHAILLLARCSATPLICAHPPRRKTISVQPLNSAFCRDKT